MPSCSRREMIVSNVLALERLLLRQIKTLVVNVSHCDKVLNISNPKWGRIPAIKRCCKHAPSPVASIAFLGAAYWTGVGRQTTWGKGHIEVGIGPFVGFLRRSDRKLLVFCCQESSKAHFNDSRRITSGLLDHAPGTSRSAFPTSPFLANLRFVDDPQTGLFL